MHDPLPGLNYRTVGLDLIKEATYYIKDKAKKWGKKQVVDVAEDIVNNQKGIREAVTDKVAALAKIGRGRSRKRKRSRSVGASRSRSVRRGNKRGRRHVKRTPKRRGRKRGRKSKKRCLKGTIFS